MKQLQDKYKFIHLFTRHPNQDNPPVPTRLPRLTYIRDKNKVPVACLAYSHHMEASGSVLRFGLSVHNPSDRFNREVAADLAIGRFVRSPIIIKFDANTTLKNMLHDLMVGLINDKNSPNRLKKAAKNYIDHNQAKANDV